MWNGMVLSVAYGPRGITGEEEENQSCVFLDRLGGTKIVPFNSVPRNANITQKTACGGLEQHPRIESHCRQIVCLLPSQCDIQPWVRAALNSE